MWTAVALTTVLTLAPAQTLELKNVRSTYGIMGETRKSDKLLPGDVLCVAFDVEGLKVEDSGRVQYAMGMELIQRGKEKKGDKSRWKKDPQDYEGENTLGGTTLPVFAYTPIRLDDPPGEYVFKITVKDRAGKSEKVLSKEFEVLPLKLGFVRVFLSRSGDNVPPLAVVGQRIWVHYTLVGFKLDKAKLPNVTFEMVLLDEADKPTVKNSFKGDIKSDLKATPGVMEFLPRPLDLNRPGKFKIVITATDNVSKEKAEQTLNLTVVKPPE